MFKILKWSKEPGVNGSHMFGPSGCFAATWSTLWKTKLARKWQMNCNMEGNRRKLRTSVVFTSIRWEKQIFPNSDSSLDNDMESYYGQWSWTDGCIQSHNAARAISKKTRIKSFREKYQNWREDMRTVFCCLVTIGLEEAKTTTAWRIGHGDKRTKDKGHWKASLFLWKYKEDNIPAFFMELVLQEWNKAKIIFRRNFQLCIYC